MGLAQKTTNFDEERLSDTPGRLEILGNSRISLLWEDGGILDTRIPPGLHVSNDRLPADFRVRTVRRVAVIVAVRGIIIVVVRRVRRARK